LDSNPAHNTNIIFYLGGKFLYLFASRDKYCKCTHIVQFIPAPGGTNLIGKIHYSL
jgi:hypothetical protein